MIPIRGPFKGVISDFPAPGDPQGFDDIVNFFCRKGRMQSRPKLSTFSTPPDGAPVMYMQSYLDVLGNIHTVAITTKNVWALTFTGPATYTWNQLTYPGGITSLIGTSFPFAVANVVDRLYFSNGSCKLLYTDGETSLKVAGDVPGACRYLDVNAAHLIGAYWTEPAPGVDGSKQYPKRIRWSKSGDPDNWTAFSAGLADLLEVADQITGVATLGRNTYVFRSNGISIMYATGIADAAFRIENMSQALAGIGNSYPYSLAKFSDMAFFVAKDDIYALVSGQLEPVGTSSKKKIFADINSASGGQVIGTIIPSMGPSYDFLSYWLSIPGVNVTWVYDFNSRAWTRFTSTKGKLTSIGSVSIN